MTIFCLSTLIQTSLPLASNGNIIATPRCRPYQTPLVRLPNAPLGLFERPITLVPNRDLSPRPALVQCGGTGLAIQYP
jgi:hypothetical protein